MRCQHCKHSFQAHGPDGKCRIKIGVNMNRITGEFAEYRPCECSDYSGPAPSDCPHDFQCDSTNPHRCLYCGDIIKKSDARNQ